MYQYSTTTLSLPQMMCAKVTLWKIIDLCIVLCWKKSQKVTTEGKLILRLRHLCDTALHNVYWGGVTWKDIMTQHAGLSFQFAKQEYLIVGWFLVMTIIKVLLKESIDCHFDRRLKISCKFVFGERTVGFTKAKFAKVKVGNTLWKNTCIYTDWKRKYVTKIALYIY